MTIFISILTFILGLLCVICLHELGHFFFAKKYGIFCYEYSIGFGPKMVSKRFKNRETRLTVRWIPLGGYVSMAGDEEEEEEKAKSKTKTNLFEPDIPKERTLAHVSKPKQIIVMFGGVLVNFVLAFLLFFIKNVSTPFYNSNTNVVAISENSNALEAGFLSGDKLLSIESVSFSNPETQVKYDNLSTNVKTTYFVKDINNFNDLNSPLFMKDENNSASESNFDLRPTKENETFSRTIKFLRPTYDESTQQIKYVSDTKTVTTKVDSATKTIDENDVAHYSYELFGFSRVASRMSFGEAIVKSFIDFGQSIYSVFYAIGMLFTPSGVQNVGGLLSIFVINQQAVSMGFGTVLYIWGLISANLGVFNLIPFPGLDGWQIVLATIEGISRKKISSKFKTIAGNVGMIIMFALSGLLLVLDIFRYF